MKKKKETKEGVNTRKTNLSDWYTEVVQKADLADYAPVKGFMIIKPYIISRNLIIVRVNMIRPLIIIHFYIPIRKMKLRKDSHYSVWRNRI